MKRLFLFLLLVLPFFALQAQTTDEGKPEVTVNDGTIGPNAGDVYWTKDNVYLLDGYVYVEEGTRLHIEAGTVIKGIETPSTGDIASVLVISRGAQIFAEGTAQEPIIFTTEYDAVSLPDDGTDPGVQFDIDKGLWGGVVLLGRATLNVASEKLVEGLPNDPRAFYGGTNDADNSGVFRYVSIRYTGITVEANNELQGLTVGCAGSSTTIEFVESFRSDDDGFEFFGGTVNTKYLISAFASDDGFDYDQGFRGYHQFWFGIQMPDDGDHVGEFDSGDEGALTAEPLSYPVIYNATFLGRGAGSTGGDDVVRYKEYAGGEMVNSIFADFDNYGMDVQGGDGLTSKTRLENGEIVINNNIWYSGSKTVSDLSEADYVVSYLSDAANNNAIVDPLISTSRAADGGLDPRPQANGPAWSAEKKAKPDGAPFTTTSYVGAFGNNLWAHGWTALSQTGILATPEPAPTVIVNDASIGGNMGDVYWTKDKTYILDGYVYVEAGTRLNIEAGTVIKALESPTSGDIASVLVITRGAQIFAMGTQEEPIIFTTEYDDVTLPDNGADPGVQFDIDKGLWGGVVILGRATLNVAAEKLVEGLPNDPRAFYGGTDDADNSGIMRYVSIRYTGITVEANNELQGLTVGCAGSGTTLEFIESFRSDDDGFEFFGGTVNTRYLVSAFASDDGFDYDQGFRGDHQFWFGIQMPNDGDHVGEFDSGDEGALTAEPHSYPRIYNSTFLGRGAGASGGDDVVRYKEYAGGEFKNSIFADFDNYGLDVQGGDGLTSKTRLENGEIVVTNNIWFSGTKTVNDLSEADYVVNYLSDGANMNSVVDPLISTSRLADGGLDPRPALGSPAWTSELAAAPEGFLRASYVGAFGNNLWIDGWTALSQTGIVGEQQQGEKTVVYVQDDDISGNQGDVFWTQNNIYMLDGYVYVESGTTLNIEAGTVIKGLESPTTGDIASVLVIARGAKINAVGTREEPIIFTTEYDDTELPDNGTDPGVQYDIDKGLWGGVVILGRAPLNVASEKVVEGLPNDPRAFYGGTDPEDNSGTMRYVSIRYTGITVEANNELQGLTVGCLGSGTTLEYIESFRSDDDGFEFFGGTVNTKYLISAFASDDGFDYDQGFRGQHQFWFGIQMPNDGDHVGEFDSGDEGALTAEPHSYPVIYNATLLGRGASSTGGDDVVRYKEYAGGEFVNSIFADFDNYGMDVQGGDGLTSKTRLENGELLVTNNLWHSGTKTVNDLSEADYVISYLSDAANSNTLADPMINVSRLPNGGLDPRPEPESPAWTAARKAAAEGGHIEEVNYVGAFGHDLWIEKWTALAQTGLVGEITVGVEEEEVEEASVPNDFNLTQNYPNPFNPSTSIQYSVPQAAQVTIVIYNILGQQVAQLVNDFKSAGTYELNWNAENLPSGMYIYRMEAGEFSMSKKMTLLK